MLALRSTPSSTTRRRITSRQRHADALGDGEANSHHRHLGPVQSSRDARSTPPPNNSRAVAAIARPAASTGGPVNGSVLPLTGGTVLVLAAATELEVVLGAVVVVVNGTSEVDGVGVVVVVVGSVVVVVASVVVVVSAVVVVVSSGVVQVTVTTYSTEVPMVPLASWIMPPTVR